MPKAKSFLTRRPASATSASSGMHKIEYSGPMYESMKLEGSAIRLKFSHVDGGLVAKVGLLKHFAVAGADKKFFWAEAKIDGETVVVSSPAVGAPVAVRYAWADNPEGCNLYNAAGLGGHQLLPATHRTGKRDRGKEKSLLRGRAQQVENQNSTLNLSWNTRGKLV